VVDLTATLSLTLSCGCVVRRSGWVT
jgi:hypothetical protein